jgi:hypothetical protein
VQLELRQGTTYTPHVQPTHEAIASAVSDFLGSISDLWFQNLVGRQASGEELTDNVLEQASMDLELAAFLGKAPALSSMIASMPDASDSEDGSTSEDDDDLLDLGIAMVVHDWARSKVHILAADLVFFEVWLSYGCSCVFCSCSCFNRTWIKCQPK